MSSNERVTTAGRVCNEGAANGVGSTIAFISLPSWLVIDNPVDRNLRDTYTSHSPCVWKPARETAVHRPPSASFRHQARGQTHLTSGSSSSSSCLAASMALSSPEECDDSAPDVEVSFESFIGVLGAALPSSPAPVKTKATTVTKLSNNNNQGVGHLI